MTDKNANTEIRKEFCPNCEAETPCTHEAELEKRTAGLHYANAVCMEMKHELARRDEIIARLKAELAELNDKAVFIQFENEDELPADISNDVYSTMFNCSHVDGVRLFPYIEENGQKYFLVMLREDE